MSFKVRKCERLRLRESMCEKGRETQREIERGIEKDEGREREG